MKILLSYSKKHFDPLFGIKINHSAGVLAKALYEILSELGSVEYTDWNEKSLNDEYDLIVTLPRHLPFIKRNVKCNNIFCFPAIAESSFTKKVLREEADRLGCKVSDCYAPEMYFSDVKYLIIGNKFVGEKYILAGYRRNQICMLNYGMPNFSFNYISKPTRHDTIFLYIATTLGLRKGFWWVVNDFLRANIPNSQLICVGKVQHGEKFWYDFVKSINDPRIKINNFLDNNSDEYIKLLKQADYFFYPSLSEGQPGTVLEAMSVGCIPILTEEAGVDYYPFGEYIRGETVNLLKEAANLSDEDYYLEQKKLKSIVQTEYNIENFKRTVKQYVKNNLG